jgi:hypothetical protein
VAVEGGRGRRRRRRDKQDAPSLTKISSTVAASS